MATILYPLLAVIVAVIVMAVCLKDAKALALKVAEWLGFWGVGICLYQLARVALRLP
jgi:hypothetical protein